MTDSEIKLISGVVVGAVGLYIKLVKLIDKKIGDSQKAEEEKRRLRAISYKQSFDNLDAQTDKFIHKMISLESELKDREGVYERLQALELSFRDIQEAIKELRAKNE